jgi:hypothetical protein
LKAFQRGIGIPLLFWFRLAGVVAFFVEKGWRTRVLLSIFAVNAVLLAVFSMNNTAMTYRNFVLVAWLTLPLAAYSLERLVGRRWLYLAAGIALGALLVRTYPYLDFHTRYHSQAEFFAGLTDKIGAGAVLLTMDYAGLAEHYLGRPTKRRAPDPYDAQAAAFVTSLRDDTAQAYYLLPDAFVNDAGRTVRRKLREAFTFELVHEG